MFPHFRDVRALVFCGAEFALFIAGVVVGVGVLVSCGGGVDLVCIFPHVWTCVLSGWAAAWMRSCMILVNVQCDVCSTLHRCSSWFRNVAGSCFLIWI